MVRHQPLRFASRDQSARRYLDRVRVRRAEDFLVLHGECIAIIEEEERPLRQWDFVHCPPGTRHVFVGAGDGPCAILMIGARDREDETVYPASEVAARYGASAAETTTSGREAYRDFPPHTRGRFTWPPAPGPEARG